MGAAAPFGCIILIMRWTTFTSSLPPLDVGETKTSLSFLANVFLKISVTVSNSNAELNE